MSEIKTEKSLAGDSKNKIKKKKTYIKPEIKSERILEAGLGATCNGTSNGGRKSSAPACNAGSLKT